MNEEAKKRIAEFRFGVIHDLIGDRKLNRGQRKRLLKEKAACEWEIPHTGRSGISISTILSWVRRYERGGRRLESLYPEQRNDRGRPRALSEETVLGLCELKKQFKGASLPVVLRQARLKNIIGPEFKAANATIYRLFKQRGLMNREEQLEDRRRFEAELPNDIWQSDCMHGPMVDVEGRQRKSYLFAFIDDMSRLICHAEFYLNERIETYTDALSKALKKRGLPRKLYVDNGPAFRSHQLSHATASLGIALIHSKPYQPQGRGKIERFFRTVRMQFLSTCAGAMTLQQLNDAVTQWLDTHYHQNIHSSTRQTPLNRYLKHAHLLRVAPKDLDDYFRLRVQRKVDKDRTVSLNGRLYEAPVELIGRVATVLFHEADPARVEIFCEGVSRGMLVPLDLNVNCRIRRRNYKVELLPPTGQGQEGPETVQRYEGGKLFGSQEDSNGIS
jgi:transposase InsO family protein